MRLLMKDDQDLSECDCYDAEASMIGHSIDYMNECDGRARERLIFYLVHRYFPNGSFTPGQVPQTVLPVNPNEQ